MSFYGFNIYNAIINIISPDKRYTDNISYLRSLMSTLQWCRDLFFSSYNEGINTPYVDSNTYKYLDQVVFEGKVYSSLINSNNDIPTSSNWELVQDDFVGVVDRLKITSNKLVQEFALNRQFGTIFRPPILVTDTQSASDIFITNNNPVYNDFLCGYSESESSDVTYLESADVIPFAQDMPILDTFLIGYTEDESDAVTYLESPQLVTYFDYVGISERSNNFTVNIPTSIVNLFGTKLNAFIEKYIPLGLTYNIKRY
jgi:hypothetical protein